MSLPSTLVRHAFLFLLSLPALAADIVVGQIAPFSGPLAPTGLHLRAGIQIYFDAINSGGGINGNKIRLVTKDDAYKVDETLRLSRELIAESNPLALIGLVGTGNLEALAKSGMLAAADIPLVGMRSGASSLFEPVNPHLFHTRASYGAEIDKVARHFALMGMKRIAVLYQNDPFGLDGLKVAETRALKDNGLTLAAKAGYEKNTTEVAAAVKTITGANPDGIILVANTAASAEFIKQARQAGNGSMIFALSVTDGPQVAKKIGAALARGVGVVQVSPNPVSPTLSLTRDLKKYYGKFAPPNTELNHTLVEGYLAAKVLTEGLRRAGPAPTRKKLREALETLRDYDAGGLFINYSAASHAGSGFIELTMIGSDGNIVY